MAKATNISARPPITKGDMAEMEKYGITTAPVDIFYHGEYRYSTLRDALAQAKRAADKT